MPRPYGALHSLLVADVFGLAGRLLPHAAARLYIWVTLLTLAVLFNRW